MRGTAQCLPAFPVLADRAAASGCVLSACARIGLVTGATRDAVLCSLSFAPGRCDQDRAEPTPVAVDGLPAQLIGRLGRADLPDGARPRAALPLLAEGQPAEQEATLS